MKRALLVLVTFLSSTLNLYAAVPITATLRTGWPISNRDVAKTGPQPQIAPSIIDLNSATYFFSGFGAFETPSQYGNGKSGLFNDTSLTRTFTGDSELPDMVYADITGDATKEIIIPTKTSVFINNASAAGGQATQINVSFASVGNMRDARIGGVHVAPYGSSKALYILPRVSMSKLPDLMVYSPQGALLRRSTISSAGLNLPSEYGIHLGNQVLADINNDGQSEIIFNINIQSSTNSRVISNYLMVLNLDGNSLAGWPRELGSRESLNAAPLPPSIADLDKDGDLDIAVVNYDSSLYAFNNEGNALPGYPIEVGEDTNPEVSRAILQGQGFRFDQAYTSLPIVDLEGDGYPEMIISVIESYSNNSSSSNALYVINHDGTVKSGWPIRTTVSAAGYEYRYPIVVDLDNDGVQEIITISGSTDTNKPGKSIKAYKIDGSEVTGFKLELPRDQSYTNDSYETGTEAAVADVDNDGLLELFYHDSRMDQSYLWDLSTPATSRAEWPAFGGKNRSFTYIPEIKTVPDPVVFDTANIRQVEGINVLGSANTISWSRSANADSYSVVIKSVWGTVLRSVTGTATSFSLAGLPLQEGLTIDVSPVNRIGVGATSSLSFTIAPDATAAPSTVWINSPASNNAVITKVKPNLSWTAVGDAIAYQLSLEQLQPVAQTVLDKKIVTFNDYNGSTLSYGLFKMKLAAINAAGLGTIAERTFYVAPNATTLPGAVTITGPNAGFYPNIISNASPIVASWNAVATAMYYELTLMKKVGETYTAVGQPVISYGTSYTIPTTLEAGDYYVRVRAYNMIGYGPGKNLFFTVAAPASSIAPRATNLKISPNTSNFDITNVKRPTISWTGSGATVYQVRIVNPATGATIPGQDVILPGNVFSYTPTADLVTGKNIVKITAANSMGVSDQSIIGFYVLDPINQLPSAARPNVSMTDKVANISWAASTGNVVYYHVIIQQNVNGTFQPVTYNNATFRPVVEAPTTSYAIPFNLAVGSYRVCIVAYNSKGTTQSQYRSFNVI